MTPSLPITVCMMCLNEASRLPISLERINEFAEWIVLDTGSSDDTVEIARRHGATVRSITWAGFSETRRAHFLMATQPWILWLDADEVITAELVAELRALFQGDTPPPHAAYRINRIMHFEGQWIRFGDWYPDRVLRLFRADAWSISPRSVHESVEISGSIGRLRHELPHYSYRSWRDREERIVNYARLWARQEASQGRSCNSWEPAARAGWRFIRNYLIKGGIRGGRLGLRIALSCGRETWLKYAALAPSARPLADISKRRV